LTSPTCVDGSKGHSWHVHSLSRPKALDRV
jgi:hypothetical protein